MATIERSQTTLPDGGMDLRRSLALQALGKVDPTAGFTDDGFWKVFSFNGSNVRAQLSARPQGELEVVFTGPGSTGLLEQWGPHLLPTEADLTWFRADERVARLQGRFPGLRVFPVPWLFDVACSCVLQQRVRFEDACAGWRRIAERFGHRDELGLSFPPAQTVARLGTAQLEALGVDAKRARTLIGVAKEEVFAKFLRLGSPSLSIRKRFASIQGIGPWTTEMFMGFGKGDPDALPLGDVHLPRLVGAAFGQAGTTDDARMTELLEPFRGNRFRVVRLIFASVFHATKE